MISFEMSWCGKKNGFMRVSVKLIHTWFWFSVHFGRSKENGQWSRKPGIFQFLYYRLKTDSYSSPGLRNDRCSGKALEIDDLIKIASHTKICWGRIARNWVTNLKDVTEYPALLCA